MNTRGSQIAKRIMRSIELAARDNVATTMAEELQEFAAIYAALNSRVKEIREQEKDLPPITMLERAWMMCTAMCAGIQ